MADIEQLDQGDDRPLILVVDDDPVMRMYAGERLAKSGFSAHLVEDGPRAVAAVREYAPDLVILDVQMPGMDGFQTCKSIRRSAEGRHTPILMLTALDDLSSIQQAYEAGATDFASKPANWPLLAHRLEYILRSSRSAGELRESRSRLANAQRIAKLGYWEWDLTEGEFVASDQMIEILGPGARYKVPNVRTFLELVHEDDREHVLRSIKSVVDEGETSDLEFRLCRPDGEERYVRQRIELPSERAQGVKRLVATVQDATDQKRAEERVRFLASHDGLTSLPNRSSFTERVDIALTEARRYGRQFALLLIDLDRFNRINDIFGRSAGDSALQQIADRLLAFVRRTDVLGRPTGEGLVARFGGDEFALLIGDVTDPRDAAGIAGRLAAVLAQPLSFNGKEVVITASVGISVFPGDGNDAETLMGNAEAAMYDTRNRGGDNFQYYSKEMNQHIADHLVLETDLNQALERGELLLNYQPQYCVATGEIVGAEALLRWQHPERGLISPAEFIPVAEGSGAIVAIGEWVLRQACKQAQSWQQPGEQELGVSVNVSARQLERPDFAHTVERALADSGLEPRLLNLEITESFFLEDIERAVRSLQALKKIGICVSLDDFGTGFSSFSYLMRLPLDAIKIDRSFLTGVPMEAEHQAITSAIIALARSVDLQVVAEGVETTDQHEFLRQRQCDSLQGFLFSKPLTAPQFEELCRESPVRRSAVIPDAGIPINERHLTCDA